MDAAMRAADAKFETNAHLAELTHYLTHMRETAGFFRARFNAAELADLQGN